jgi:hypothetical protein
MSPGMKRFSIPTNPIAGSRVEFSVMHDRTMRNAVLYVNKKSLEDPQNPSETASRPVTASVTSGCNPRAVPGGSLIRRDQE